MMPTTTRPNCNLAPDCRCSTTSHGGARLKASDHQTMAPAKSSLDGNAPRSTTPKPYAAGQERSLKLWQAKATVVAAVAAVLKSP